MEYQRCHSGRRAIQFGYAGSYSGYLNISAPGMREALRLVRLHSRGPTNAVFRYPAGGVHAWRYRAGQVLETLPDLSR
ncbi:hypothetical protein [Nocardia vinacea]|uniref:hypothetical protein n=1 Tax=Nocardia vinacea TaxID=96468 RepID=UPI000594D344|nr:hypothetical protein [Nocardia vinacea]